MENFAWEKLQNGSDIRGVALDGVEGENVNLSPDIAATLGKAFVTWLATKASSSPTDLTIAVGRDSRISGPALMKAVMEGIAATGCRVYDFAMASTPAMFMSTVTPGYTCHGAIMLTASHLPFNRNGLKFFTPQGGLEKQDITDILALAKQGNFPQADAPGGIEARDFIAVYAEQLVNTIRQGVAHPDHFDEPLKGLKICSGCWQRGGGVLCR